MRVFSILFSFMDFLVDLSYQKFLHKQLQLNLFSKQLEMFYSRMKLLYKQLELELLAVGSRQ
jgi:hypothetical protein